MRADVTAALEAFRRDAPLVHCIVSTASMSLVADGLLAAGARPMMTETKEEAPTLVGSADALLVNLGTLSRDGAAGIPATVAAARAAGVPWVLDPTAVGLAPVRTPLARTLLHEGPAVVRGNASEILVLVGGQGGRGADSTLEPAAVAAVAHELACHHRCVVAASGAVDHLVDATTVVRLANGTPMLTRVTGTGCLLGALTAALVAATEARIAAVAATALLTVAAESALERSSGPGSFRVALLDALAAVSPDEVATRMVLQ
ncbi:hydroxyethylthiazole kinase [Mariniluteicoccus flavus]